MCDYIVAKGADRELTRHAGVVIRGVPSPKAGGVDCVVRMRSVSWWLPHYYGQQAVPHELLQMVHLHERPPGARAR